MEHEYHINVTFFQKFVRLVSLKVPSGMNMIMTTTMMMATIMTMATTTKNDIGKNEKKKITIQ